MAAEYFCKDHLVIARTNRFRLRLALMALTVSALGIATPTLLTQAAATTTTSYLDGVKILNSGTGTYGGSTTGAFSSATVTVKRVSTGVSVSSATNPFYFNGLAAVSAGENYLVSISPVTVGGYTIKGITYCSDACTGYIPQSTNFRSGSAATLKFAPNHNYHMRWIYMLAPTPVPTPVPTPKPTAVPTPVPAPVRTPVRTPVPVTKATPKPNTGSAANPTSIVTSNPTAVPASPGNFKAVAASENAVVSLSWDASIGVNGVQSYKLERSIDQTNWTVVGGGILNPGFLDDTVAFGVHYYYRVSAISISGVASGYAFGDAQTAEFVANSVNSAVADYLSSDNVVRVEVPAGAISNDSAVCTVEVSTATLGTTARPVVAGPYSLICKTAAGDLITDLVKPVSWTFELATKLKGYDKPSAVSVDSSGGQSDVKNAAYNTKAQTLQFNQSTVTTTAVLASKVQGISAFLVVGALILLLAVGAVFTLFLRKSQKQDYSEYLRRKYYDF